MALEIIADLNYEIRSFVSSLEYSAPEYLTDFTSLSVGTEYTETSSDWVRSSSSAIKGIIENDGQNFLKFRQYGYQGGRLTRTFPEPIQNINIQFLIPDYTSNDVGIKLKSTAENVKITIDRNSIKVYQFDTVYNLILTVDISTSTIGDIVYISTSVGNTFLNVQATGFPTETIAITSMASLSLSQIEFFTEEGSNYPITLKILAVNAFGDEQRNLNLSILPQLATEYIVGDILIVSVHERYDSSILPRNLVQFEALAPTKDVSLYGYEDGFQRFWGRTLTVNEPNVYQFTRGDDSSYYDDPKLVGFIIRGALLEDLSVSWADAIAGENVIGATLASNSCGATQGDLVYGYAHNESNYDQMYSSIPFTDFLWYHTYPYGVTSLREASTNDDGIVRFQCLTNGFDYKIFAARISSDTPEPPTLPRLREYETQLPEEAPPRLQDFYSQRLLAVLGAVKDDAIADSLDAIAETFASTASEKRLLELGTDRLIDRYPTENLESYRQAVVNASSILEWRGTPKGIEDEITRFGYTATYIPLRYTDPLHWSEFILILRNGRIQHSLSSGGPWNMGMSLLERNALLKLIKRWKNSDERLAMIGYAFGNNDFWGESSTWGDNTTWNSGGTIVIYARPYAWGDNPNDTWNSSHTWGDTDTYPVQEG
jgi:hypothetical protein